MGHNKSKKATETKELTEKQEYDIAFKILIGKKTPESVSKEFSIPVRKVSSIVSKISADKASTQKFHNRGLLTQEDKEQIRQVHKKHFSKNKQNPS